MRIIEEGHDEEKRSRDLQNTKTGNSKRYFITMRKLVIKIRLM